MISQGFSILGPVSICIFLPISLKSSSVIPGTAASAKIALKNNEAYHHDNVAKKGDITIDRLKGFNGKYFSIYHDNPLDWDWYINDVNVEDVKPYLFPLSSMTEEQQINLTEYLNARVFVNGEISFQSLYANTMDRWKKVFEWCLKNQIGRAHV